MIDDARDEQIAEQADTALARDQPHGAQALPPAQLRIAGQTWIIQPRREQTASRPPDSDEPADWYVDVKQSPASWNGSAVAGPYASAQEALSAGMALIFEEVAEHAPERTPATRSATPAARAAASAVRWWDRPRLTRVRHRVGAAFIGALFTLLAVIVLAQIAVVPAWWPTLPQARDAGQQTAPTVRPPDLSTRMVATIPGVADTASIETAQIQAFLIPQTHAGLYKPSIDAKGNIWVGQMTTNLLARLSPHDGLVTTWAPPDGRGTLAATAIDRQGRVWFTEQAANYIGRFDPTTQSFVTYPLTTLDGRSTMPQDLAFDANGVLWFTQVSAGQIGRLDPASGAIQTFSLPQPPSGGRVSPFGLTVAPNGHIWYASMSGGVIGELNPATTRVRQYPLADPATRVFALTADSAGRIWFTEFNQGRLGMVDPQTGRVTERAVPATLGGVSGLYGLVVTPDGRVWFGVNSINALIRYIPGDDHFTFFTLTIPQSAPYGLIHDATGHIWFTAGTVTASYIGELTP